MTREQLADSAGWLADLLAAAPGLVLLATSQKRLPLPAAPRSCGHRVCAPLADRYEAALQASGRVAVLGQARMAR